MKKIVAKFLKYDITVKLSLLVCVLLFLAIGITIFNALKVQEDEISRVQNDFISSNVCQEKPACLNDAVPCDIEEPVEGWCESGSVQGESTYYVRPTLYCIGSCPVSKTPTPSVYPHRCPSGTVFYKYIATDPPQVICIYPSPTIVISPSNTPRPTRVVTPTKTVTPTRAVTPTKVISPTTAVTPKPTSCYTPSLTPSITPLPNENGIGKSILDLLRKILDMLCKTFGICNIALPKIDAPTTPVKLTPKLDVVLRVDAGGNKEIIDNNRRLWVKDTGFVGGTKVDRGNISIQNTINDRIYQTERWGMTAANYAVQNGDYKVRMHFAETFTGITKAGQRVFNVDINGVSENNIDIFARVKGRNKAYTITKFIKVEKGKINIKFTAIKGAPVINGIEIFKIVPICGISLSPTINPISATPSMSVTPTATTSPTPSMSVAPTPSVSPSVTLTVSPTQSVTSTPTVQPTQTPTIAPTATYTPTISPSLTSTPVPTNTPVPSPSMTTPTPTARISFTPAPTLQVPTVSIALTISPINPPSPTPIPGDDFIRFITDLINKLIEWLRGWFQLSRPT